MKQILVITFFFFLVQGISQSKITGTYHVQQSNFEPDDPNIWTDWCNKGIAKFGKDGYLGLIDSTGQILCDATYDKIFDFEGKTARVIHQGKYGLINQSGKVILKPELNAIHEFNNELAICESGRLKGIVKKNGKFLVKPKYRILLPNNTGSYTYFMDHTFGLINQKGKEIPVYNNESYEVVSLRYDHPILKFNNHQLPMFDFHEGLCPTVSKIEDQYKFGFMNTELKTVIQPAYDWVESFNGNYAIVHSNDLWGVIDQDGNVILPVKYHFIKHATKNKFIFSMNGESFGLIDDNQKVILKAKYASLHYLFDDLYATHGEPSKLMQLSHSYSGKIEMAWGVVNELGDYVLPRKYLGVGKINDSLGVVASYTNSSSLNTGIPRYHLFATITPFNQDSLFHSYTTSYTKLIEMRSDWYSGYVETSDPAFYLPITYNINTVLNDFNSIALDSIRNDIQLNANYWIASIPDSSSSGLSGISLNMLPYTPYQKEKRKYGIINKDGQVMVPLIYDELKNAGLNIFLVKEKDNWGIINFRNEIVIPIKYNYIEINESIILVRNKIAEYKYEYAIFDLSGNILLPFKGLPYGTPYRLHNGMIIKCESACSYYIDKKGNKIE